MATTTKATKGARGYASGTTVPVYRSKAEIESELQRMGATKRLFYDDDEHHQVMIMFERENRRYRILLPLPDPEADGYRYSAQFRRRSDTTTRAAWEQECRERWRALVAYMKALRVGWEAGIVRIEDALLHAVMLPDGETVGQWVAPQLPRIYGSNQMPPLLPGAGETTRVEEMR